MKILFVLPQIPYPPHSGGRIVTWNTVKRFARDWDVYIACLYHHPTELAHLDTVKTACRECAAFPAHGKWALAPMLKSFTSPWPYKAHRFYNSNMMAYIQRLLAREPMDVIHAQNFYTTTYVSAKESCLKIHYKENIEGNILRRYAAATKNPLIKTLARLEGWRTLCFEQRACEKFDHIFTISPKDRETLLQRNPSLPVEHQMPGVDLADYPYDKEQATAPTVVFTGTMSYYPNADGVQDFLRRSWPRIKNQVPNAECYIVGANPSRAIQAYDGHNQVHITGRVNNVREYLHRAAVYIVPLRIGGGIRLKILEAMASGRAIVSTSIGCEGLQGEPGKHLMIEDNPNRFADAVADLLQHKEKREHLRKNARALIETCYDWDKVIRNQQARVRSLLMRFPSHPRP
ncbi:glycosyltransferase [bacterium]|nr:glycosyltransferase [bacterium]